MLRDEVKFTNYWQRVGTILSPVNANDNVALGSGFIQASALWDAAQTTGVQVEEALGEGYIRFDTDGFERMVINSDGDIIFYGATSGRFMLWDESEDALFLPDNTELRFGNTSLSSGGLIEWYDVLFVNSFFLIKANSQKIRMDGLVEVLGGVGVKKWRIVDGNGDLGVSADFEVTNNSQFDGTVTVGINGSGADVKFFGSTSNYFMLWDESEDQLRIEALDTGFLYKDLGSVSGRGNRNVARWTDLNDNMVMEFTYANIGDKDMEIRFGDDENTKIGFPDVGYFAFKNDVTEIRLGTTGDPNIYTNYNVGTGEYHGTPSNEQNVIYYVNTEADGSGFTISGAMDISRYIYHTDDYDTHMNFQIDKWTLTCGGEALIEVVEAAQDYVKLGDGGDVDINLASGRDKVLFIEGSSGIVYIGDGGTTNYTQFASNGDLSFAGSAGFYPVRLAQSAQPTPDTGELILWRDTDDGKVYLVYNDADSGVKQVEMV